MEDENWWMHSEAVVMTAEYMVLMGANGAEVLDLFQYPWDHDSDYEAAKEFGVRLLTGE